MKDIPELLAELTLEEKAALVEGAHFWHTNAVPRLGIPALFLADGPHGLRRVRESAGSFAVAGGVYSTAFPTAAAAASSWEPENARRMGEAIAAECRAAGVNVLLAPGVNIQRSPLCGRHFEYYSEDPLLAGRFGSAFVQGVQSRGVGCAVKHFAANSCENYRLVGDSEVDERALREIYLPAFRRIVREAKPAAVMCAYNRLNGEFCSQNRRLLTGILREEWGYAGAVMTDWGATCDRVRGVQAGCDLDMPGNVRYNRRRLIEAVRSGRMSAAALDRSVARVLALVKKYAFPAGETAPAPGRQAAISCAIAKDSAVLLKNDGTLPLTGREKLLVVGEMFHKMRFQGAGSSLINPPEVLTPREAFDRRGIRYTYKKGYRSLDRRRAPALERAALAAADRADTILFFGGLTDFDESEGFDRADMRLGENQSALLQALLNTGKKVVLVLFAGAPVELPFFDRLAALLDMALPGMYGGEAAAALLTGEANPAGRLAQSWPLCAAQSSCAADFDRGPVARYYESVYVGYRFYDKAGTKLRFPFGYGLSYTSFALRGASLRREGGRVTVTVEAANTGAREGAEVVQLYVKNPAGGVFRPEKELRAFAKVHLRAGESRKVTLSFDESDLACWDTERKNWVLANGEYTVCVGVSAADIRLTLPLPVTRGEPAKADVPEVAAAYAVPPREVPAAFSRLLGRPLPLQPPVRPLSMESMLADYRRTPIGRLLFALMMHRMRRDYRAAQGLPDSLERDNRLKNAYFLARQIPFNSLRSLCMASDGQLPYHMAVGLMELANGRLFHSLRAFFFRRREQPAGGRR